MLSGSGVVRRATQAPPPRLPRRLDEAGRLHVEHRAVAAAEGHQLLVAAQLDHPAVLDHADAVGQPHGREPVGHEDRRAVAGRGEDPLEDLGLAPDVELGGRLVEQHHPGSEPHLRQRPGEGDPLPLTARQVDAAVVGPGQHHVEAGEAVRAGVGQRGLDLGVDLARSRPGRERRWTGATARSARSPGTRRPRRSATPRGRARAGRCRRPRWRRTAGRTGGTAAWPGWSCPAPF